MQMAENEAPPVTLAEMATEGGDIKILNCLLHTAIVFLLDRGSQIFGTWFDYCVLGPFQLPVQIVDGDGPGVMQSPTLKVASVSACFFQNAHRIPVPSIRSTALQIGATSQGVCRVTHPG